MHLILEICEGFASLLKFPSVALFNFSNLNMYAMMQVKWKSENLAHILGYQTGAVTNLTPLQESRPEIPRVGRGRDTWLHISSTIFLITRRSSLLQSIR